MMKRFLPRETTSTRRTRQQETTIFALRRNEWFLPVEPTMGLLAIVREAVVQQVAALAVAQAAAAVSAAPP
jgi:hypothetical protein